MQNTRNFFIDVDHITRKGQGFSTPESVFMSRVPSEKDRVICVLAEGRGRGIRGRVTADLTATMALRFVEGGIDMEQVAQLMLHSPSETFIEKLEYPAFSLMEMFTDGRVRLLEFGHPPVLFFRDASLIPISRRPATIMQDMDKMVFFGSAQCRTNDRLILHSGSLLQRYGNIEEFRNIVKKILTGTPLISSRELATSILPLAIDKSGERPGRGITLASIYFRKARKVMVSTGAPFSKEQDAALAEAVSGFEGQKVICGGTTARIIGRELRRTVKVDTELVNSDLPPVMTMEGIDLVTEGTLTLARTVRVLEHGSPVDVPNPNAAQRLVKLLLESDVVRFQVGTRINEIHQDPTLPAELDIRRNVVRRIATILRDAYLKEVEIKYI